AVTEKPSLQRSQKPRHTQRYLAHGLQSPDRRGEELCASSSPNGRPANCARLASSRWFIALIEEAEKLWPHSSSVIALTLRVETPCTYISANAATNARSDR